jgi:hypothetical protein
MKCEWVKRNGCSFPVERGAGVAKARSGLEKVSEKLADPS